MKIKEIDIIGFKSFVDRTTLTFQPGITAIVGPNGCGKSNIVDAIRWAMGEQSPKHLRGKEMEDVIFGGSEGRKPLGMAEVSIVFSNEDGNAPEEYREFAEIMVTRRLFRSGESEYLINKVPSRLKDISELFMGTGVGTRAYSIIEQGQVGFILNAKPHERRFLIEEAAGITKYKSRKKDALSKMESTKQNLQSVGLVIAEVKRQMNALDRQAKKAEKFRRYRGEMKEIDLRLCSLDYMRFAEALLMEEEKFRGVEDEIISLETRARSYETETETLKEKLLGDEENLKKIQEHYYSAAANIQKCEDRIGFLNSRREEIEKKGLRFAEELRLLGAEQEQASEEIRAIRIEMDRNNSDLEDSEARLAKRSEELELFRTSFEEKGADLDSLKGEMVQIASQQAHSRNTVSNLEKSVEETARRIEKWNSEMDGFSVRVKEVDGDLAASYSSLEGLARKKEELISERSVLAEKLGMLKEQQHTAQNSLAEVRDDMMKKGSHLHSLKTLQDRLEGYSEGVKTIMRSESGGRYIVVSDILETEPEFEIPLEAALEGRLQYLVVNDVQDGVNGIALLKAGSSGRCGFLPVKGGMPAPVVSELAPEGAKRLLDRVRVRPGYEDVAELLLGNTYMVNGLEGLFYGAGDIPAGLRSLRFVTPDGDVMEDGRVLIGGSKEVSGHGIIHRKREIKLLSEAMESIKLEVGAIEERLREIVKERNATENGLEEINRGLHHTEMEIIRIDKDRERHLEEMNRLNQRIGVMQAEVERFISDRDGFEKELLTESAKLKDYNDLKERKEGRIRELQEELLVCKSEMDRVNSAVTEMRVMVTTLKGRNDTLNATLGKVTARQKELTSRMASIEEESADGAGEISAVAAEVEEVKQALATAISEKDETESRLTKEREGYQVETGRLRALENERQTTIRGIEALRKDMNAVEVAVAKLRLEMENISSRISESHALSVEDALARCKDLEIDETALSERQNELKRLIEELGEVNLTAIEEYNSLDERYRFLTEQQNDLTNSLESLQAAIQRINRISRERFKDTFEAVNTNFKVVFQRLFMGGKAELVLTDSEDLLEAGIEIIAQPPGKRLQSVSLLSGGEKALTAVSLIFSIFLLKPTPFCLLDEVDAPLDEANVVRFNEMVSEMSKGSQFILITHNKRTMETGDVLYGITMQEAGVSKVVSVRLKDELQEAA